MDLTIHHMNGEVLTDTEEERDLGVSIHKSLKPSCHIAHCVKRANQMLGMIRRSFQYKDIKTMLCCTGVWSDHILNMQCKLGVQIK